MACAVGLLAYLCGLAAFAPAAMIDAGLSRASEGRLRLVDARGKVWSGTGRFVFTDPSLQTGVELDLAWSCAPQSLLRGRFACDVEPRRSDGRFPVVVSWSRIELSHADILLPASVLGIVLPKLAALRLTGDVRLRIESLAIGNHGTQVKALMQWLNAGSELTLVSPLGEYELQVEKDNDVTRALLRTLQGPLSLEGGGPGAGGGPGFNLRASLGEPFRQELSPLLRLIAVEREAGTFELQVW
jgi:general secretion pathway protein N